MNWKYLAFIVLLAGWIWFCYRLYADRVFHRLHQAEEPAALKRMDQLDMPLAYTWGSALPLAGRGFDTWAAGVRRLDSLGEVTVWRGYYFRDEAQDVNGQLALGRSRIMRILDYLKLDKGNVLMEILPQEINADVRSNPFSAVTYEVFPGREVMRVRGDTMQLCFPLPDSMILPARHLSAFDRWCREQRDPLVDSVYVIGTADGTGIAESSETAIDRADVLRKRLLASGWKEEMIHLSAGQRNDPHTLLNRCVLVYIERAVK